MTDEPVMVLVEWMDAWGSSSGDWSDMKDVAKDKPMLVNETYGLLMHRSAGIITVVPTRTSPDHPEAQYQASGEMFIPERCVVRIWRLRKDDLIA